MKKYLHLVVLLAALSGSLPISTLADTMPASYILIRGFGGDDRSLPFVIITADKEIAASFEAGWFKDPTGWPKDLPALSPERSVHLLDGKALDKIEAFCEKQSRELAQKTSAPELGGFGTIKVSRRSKLHELNGFDFIVPRQDSHAFLEKLLDLLSVQGLSSKLQNDLRDVLGRIDREALTP